MTKISVLVYKAECLFVNKFVTYKFGSLAIYPTIHILNQRDPGSALVHD